MWRASKRGVAAFNYSQRVKALSPGSTYRVVIDYRWQDKKGKVLTTATRTSKGCRQREALPNLVASRVTAGRLSGRPRMATYVVNVINKGTVSTPASNLKLFVDGSTEGRAAVPALQAGQLARVSIVGPRCKATLGGEADPDGLVRESRESDNTISMPCPFG